LSWLAGVVAVVELAQDLVRQAAVLADCYLQQDFLLPLELLTQLLLVLVVQGVVLLRELQEPVQYSQ
jgi:NADH:ubiquinone oxidoreductase subunit 6 (subunit J)